MKTEIQEQQPELMSYLYQLFNNHYITLKMEITDKELSKGKHFFTKEEKYERLNEINPLLGELREQFGLDF